MKEYLPILVDGAFAIAVLGFMWKIDSDMNRKTTKLFERFDEFKVGMETKVANRFVSKDMCHMMHEHGTRDFHRVEKKIDDYHMDITKRIDRLEAELKIIGAMALRSEKALEK